MKIKSRLYLSISATLVVGLLILAYTNTAMLRMHDGLSTVNLYYELSSKVFDLESLIDEYLAGSKENADLWRSAYKATGDILGQIKPQHQEEVALLDSLLKRHGALLPLFEKLAAPNTDTDSEPSGGDSKEKQAAHFSAQIRLMYDDVFSLIKVKQSQIESSNRSLTFTTASVIILLISAVCLFLYLTNRNIFRSFMKLHEGTRLLREGNLSHSIDIERNDEIGELAQSLNEMSKALKDRTEDLHKNREWLQVTLTSIGDAVIATDTEGRITFINPAAAALTGWTIEEASGRPIENVFRTLEEQTQKPAEDIFRRVLSEARAVALPNHTVLVARDGKEIPIEDSAAPIMDDDNKVSGVVLVFHDVTERRRSQEALQRSEAMLRAVLDQLPSGVTVRDARSGFLILSNARAQEIVGTSLAGNSEQFSGYRGFHLDGRPYKTEEWPLFRSIATGEVVEAEEMEYERPDGTRITITLSSTPVRDSEGNIVIIAGSFHDITERRQAEESLRKSRDEQELRVRERTAELETYMRKLQESNQALQDFAFIASHDMQEPLRKVTSFGNRLVQKYGDSLGVEGKDYLSRMMSATERMQSLLNSLLEYSRVSTRAEPFRDVDLNSVIRGVLSDLELRIEKTGGEVIVEELPVIYAEPTQMRQLFQNLIGNGLKFHKEGEKPVLKVQSIIADSRTWQIVVEDNGIGFDEQYVEKIFQPFQRLHGRSSRYEGTGMGLAICKKIVERHGGGITARSAPGEGSSFVVSLPLAARAEIDQSE